MNTLLGTGKKDCVCTNSYLGKDAYPRGCYYFDAPLSFFGAGVEVPLGFTYLRVLMCFCTRCITDNYQGGPWCRTRCIDHCIWSDYGRLPNWKLTEDNYMNCTPEMVKEFNKTILNKIDGDSEDESRDKSDV
jgi:hypothetical protein